MLYFLGGYGFTSACTTYLIIGTPLARLVRLMASESAALTRYLIHRPCSQSKYYLRVEKTDTCV